VKGTVYTHTLVHSAPLAFVNEAPYQIVIVTLDTGGRVTGRVVGERVDIDDTVTLQEERDGIPYFQKTA
jgi:uncharacterized OB-fold protein